MYALFIGARLIFFIVYVSLCACMFVRVECCGYTHTHTDRQTDSTAMGSRIRLTLFSEGVMGKLERQFCFVAAANERQTFSITTGILFAFYGINILLNFNVL